MAQNQFVTKNGLISQDSAIISGSLILQTHNDTGTLQFDTSVTTPEFASGFAGYGARLNQDENQKWSLDLDNLSVRGRMRVYELLINQLRATNGSVWISSTGKVDSVGYTSSVNLTNGLVLHNTFINTSGSGVGSTIYDTSVTNNNLILINGALNYVTGSVGDKALFFNGATAFTSSYDMSSITNNEVAISFWLNWAKVGSSTVDMIFEGEANALWMIHLGGIGVNGMRIGLSGSAYHDIPNAITTGNNFYTIQYANNTSSLYRNGILLSSLGRNWNLVTSSYIAVGKRPVGTNYYLSGSLEDVRIYNRPLIDSEIQALYAMGNQTKYPSNGLVALYTFNDGSTTVARDYTGNGNSGSISGATIVNGVVGKALSFDGVNDWVEIANANLSTWTSQMVSNGLAISFWATIGTVDFHSPFITFMGTGSAQFWIGNDRGVDSNVGNGTGTYTYPNTSIFTGSHHWTYIHRPAINTTEIYVDGVFAGNIITNQTINATVFNSISSIRIGRDAGTEYGLGTIEDLRIYNRALTADEVSALYQNRGGIIISTSEDANHGFLEGDLIRAQRFTGQGIYRSDAVVTHVDSLQRFRVEPLNLANPSIELPRKDFEYVRIGNVYDATRQGAVYLTADDSNAPYIDVIDQVDSHNSFNAVGKIKTRTGKLSGITSTTFGALSGYGFWASGSAYLEGGINATSGKIADLTITSDKIYTGTGTFNNNNTPFFVSSSGQFSLGNKFSWNGTALTVDGNGTFSGTITASGGLIAGWQILSDRLYNGVSYSSGVIGSPLTLASVNSGSSFVYTGARMLTGLTLTWHQAGNAGHLVFGQLMSNATTLKDHYFGVQMMDYSGSEYFALSARNSGSQDVYNRIAGWAFTNQQLSSGNVVLNSSTQVIRVGDITTLTTGTGSFFSGSGEFALNYNTSNYIRRVGTSLSIASNVFALQAGTTLDIENTNGGFIGLGGTATAYSTANIAFSGSGIGKIGNINISGLANNNFIASGTTTLASTSAGFFISGSGEFQFYRDADNYIKASGNDLAIHAEDFDLNINSTLKLTNIGGGLFTLGGTTYSTAKIGLSGSGEGKLANGNISWDANGNVTLGSNVSIGYDRAKSDIKILYALTSSNNLIRTRINALGYTNAIFAQNASLDTIISYAPDVVVIAAEFVGLTSGWASTASALIDRGFNVITDGNDSNASSLPNIIATTIATSSNGAWSYNRNESLVTLGHPIVDGWTTATSTQGDSGVHILTTSSAGIFNITPVAFHPTHTTRPMVLLMETANGGAWVHAQQYDWQTTQGDALTAFLDYLSRRSVKARNWRDKQFKAPFLSSTKITSTTIESPIISANNGYISGQLRVGDTTGITLDGANRRMFIGTGTYNNTNTPFYVASGSTNIFSLGNKLTFDGTTLALNGTITANNGAIGGWVLSSTDLSGTDISLHSAMYFSDGANGLSYTGSTKLWNIPTWDQSQTSKFSGVYLNTSSYFGTTTGDIGEQKHQILRVGNNTNYLLAMFGSLRNEILISGSNVSIQAPNFYLGGTTNFISGSGGNIRIKTTNEFELSSSNVHISSSLLNLGNKLVWNGTTLTVDGDGTFSGTITASAGRIGNWVISSAGISRTITADRFIGVSSNDSSQFSEGFTFYRNDGDLPNSAISTKFIRIGKLANIGTWVTYTNGSYGMQIWRGSTSAGGDIFRVDESISQIAGWDFTTTTLSKNNTIGLNSNNGGLIALGNSSSYANATVAFSGSGQGKFGNINIDGRNGGSIFSGTTTITSTSTGFFLSGSGQVNFVQDDNNYFRLSASILDFRATRAILSSSNVQILTPNFYLGGATNFISGSGGNIRIKSTNEFELSSSNVHISSSLFRLGNNFSWNGTALSINGTITASAGLIGGFSTDATTIQSATGTLILRNNGQITGSAVLFTGGRIGGFNINADAISGTGFFISGSATGTGFFISSSAFNVKANGNITASAGLVGGFTISANSLSGTGFYISGSATGAGFFISSSAFNVKANGNITASAGLVGGFALSTTQIESTSGTLILKNSGQITGSNVLFTGGNVGGWKLSPSSLSSSNNRIVFDSAGEKIELYDSNGLQRFLATNTLVSINAGGTNSGTVYTGSATNWGSTQTSTFQRTGALSGEDLVVLSSSYQTFTPSNTGLFDIEVKNPSVTSGWNTVALAGGASVDLYFSISARIISGSVIIASSSKQTYTVFSDAVGSGTFVGTPFAFNLNNIPLTTSRVYTIQILREHSVAYSLIGGQTFTASVNSVINTGSTSVNSAYWALQFANTYVHQGGFFSAVAPFKYIRLDDRRTNAITSMRHMLTLEGGMQIGSYNNNSVESNTLTFSPSFGGSIYHINVNNQTLGVPTQGQNALQIRTGGNPEFNYKWLASFSTDGNFIISGSTARKQSGTAWDTWSDIRLKNIHGNFTDGLEAVDKINPVIFSYKGSTQKQVGIIAQEIEKIAPYMISTYKNDEIDDCRSYDATAMDFILINAIKDLHKKVIALEEEIKNLKRK